MTRPTLHLLAGTIASGKSTLADKLSESEDCILIREDEWLSRLFGDQMHTVADYVSCSAKLRAAIGPHVVTLLRAGLSVVLDFPANTPQFRAWMKGLFEEAGSAHILHVLETPKEICKARLARRNASGSHEFQVSEAQFDQISKHYHRPQADEGFDMVVHHPER